MIMINRHNRPFHWIVIGIALSLPRATAMAADCAEPGSNLTKKVAAKMAKGETDDPATKVVEDRRKGQETFDATKKRLLASSESKLGKETKEHESLSKAIDEAQLNEESLAQLERLIDFTEKANADDVKRLKEAIKECSGG